MDREGLKPQISLCWENILPNGVFSLPLVHLMDTHVTSQGCLQAHMSTEGTAVHYCAPAADLVWEHPGSQTDKGADTAVRTVTPA